MSNEFIELEEEEFTSNLTAPVLKRILSLLMPHKNWVVGFLITIALTSAGDAYFTYLNKQIVDTGIGQSECGVPYCDNLWIFDFPAGWYCVHFYLSRRRAGRKNTV